MFLRMANHRVQYGSRMCERDILGLPPPYLLWIANIFFVHIFRLVDLIAEEIAGVFKNQNRSHLHQLRIQQCGSYELRQLHNIWW